MLLALICWCLAAPLAAAPATATGGHRLEPPDERCATLIALFDDVIESRFDYRLLMLEDHELADARDLRLEAEVECRTGADAFGIDMIESALRRIGVVPPAADEVLPHD